MRRAILIQFCLAALLAGSATEALAQSKCTSLKYKFAGKAVLLNAKCLAKAAKKGIEPEQECFDKAEAFLTKQWEKAEGVGDCPTGDQATIQTDIGKFLTELIADLGTPLAAVCGNGVQESGEECDGSDDGDCLNTACLSDCTCDAGICGNGIVEANEECDGTDNFACQLGFGNCLGDCTCGVCECTNEPTGSCLDCISSCAFNFCDALDQLCLENCLTLICTADCSGGQDSCILAAGPDVGSCSNQSGDFSACACFEGSGVSECGCTCDCVP